MSSRMVRDWTNSDKIDSISFNAEVFFMRLIMKADDYGCFWADIKRLKANLFPLKSDSIRETDMLRWMAECQKTGLIVVYESDGKKYLQIVEFGQRLRTQKSKFPQPNESKVLTTVRIPRPEVEEEVEEKRKEKEKPPPTIEELKAYCILKGYTTELALKVFEYYESSDWRDKHGKKVLNWKQKLITVWFKEEHKTPEKVMIN